MTGSYSFLSTIICIAIFLGCFGCTTRDGVLSSGQHTASILVREINNVDAMIFLDHHNTEQSTNKGLIENVPIGRHVVHIFLSKFHSVPDSFSFTLDSNGIECAFELVKLAQFGTLKATSTPIGAQVALNGLVMGYTPLLIDGIAPGSYMVEVTRGNYGDTQSTVTIEPNSLFEFNANLKLKKYSLIEHFSNVNCPGCPLVSAYIDTALNQSFNGMAFGVEYHPREPFADDPMYTAAKADNDIIYEEYNPPFLPYFYIDGIDPAFNGNPAKIYDLLQSGISGCLAERPVCALMFKDITTKSGTVRVEAVASINNMELKVILIQNSVIYSVAPGTNNQNNFNDIFRDNLLSDNPKFSMETGNTKDFSFTYDLSQFEDGEFLIMALVRDQLTKKIIQTISYKL